MSLTCVGSGVTSFAQLQPLMSQNSTDTLINFGGGNTMTLNNVTFANLTPAILYSAPISGDMGITVNSGGSVVLTTADLHAIDPNAAASPLTFQRINLDKWSRCPRVQSGSYDPKFHRKGS